MNYRVIIEDGDKRVVVEEINGAPSGSVWKFSPNEIDFDKLAQAIDKLKEATVEY